MTGLDLCGHAYSAERIFGGQLEREEDEGAATIRRCPKNVCGSCSFGGDGNLPRWRSLRNVDLQNAIFEIGFGGLGIHVRR